MHPGRPLRLLSRMVPPLLALFACTGCAMLGELFATRGLRVVVLAVVVLAAVGLVASRAGKR